MTTWLVRFYDTPIGPIDTEKQRLRRLAVPAEADSEAQGKTNHERLSPMYPVYFVTDLSAGHSTRVQAVAAEARRSGC